MKKRGAKLVLVLAALMVIALPIFAYASHVELKYVNARQAYLDTFYGKTVAQLIYDESTQHNINPRLILTILQRESAAVTQSAPSSDTRAAWPMFYNYDENMANCLNAGTNCTDTKYNKPDYSYRAENYGGVGQQIAYSTAQFRNLHDSASYCGGSLAVSVDGGTITTDNAASCAMYKYTPHAVSYDTNSAFYTNWQAWWSATSNGGAYSATNTISEVNFNNPGDMTADQINAFLISKGSWLANYSIAEYLSVPYPVLVDDAPPAAPKKQGDANNDSKVDLLDLSILATWWGTTNTDSDFNHDGTVDLLDLSILASAWNT
ncbi:MAG: dockerin type I domain-containing protein [Candidatus Berkelbacteria bacterium]